MLSGFLKRFLGLFSAETRLQISIRDFAERPTNPQTVISASDFTKMSQITPGRYRKGVLRLKTQLLYPSFIPRFASYCPVDSDPMSSSQTCKRKKCYSEPNPSVQENAAQVQTANSHIDASSDACIERVKPTQKQVHKCSMCHGVDHNKRACKNSTSSEQYPEIYDKKKFESSISIDPRSRACAFCWEQPIDRIHGSSIREIHDYDAYIHPIKNAARLFYPEEDLDSLRWFIRKGSVVTRSSEDVPTSMWVCNTCHSCLTAKVPRVPGRAVANNNFVYHVPPVLQSLTFEELRMISQITPILSVRQYRPRYAQSACHDAFDTGQYYTHGNLCMLTNNVCELIKNLPRRADNCNVIHVIKRDGAGRRFSSKGRPNLLRDALNWLVNNNCLYRDVQINEALLSGMLNNLSTESSNETDMIPSIDETEDPTPENSADEAGADDDGDDDCNDTFVGSLDNPGSSISITMQLCLRYHQMFLIE
mmetsp:Transcript_12419/g.26133  ORF Transcript_12419/g.26133 Transcript_12419/m.26133 type:complete len:478 (-) Transcript_12419:717-2150(-)